MQHDTNNVRTFGHLATLDYTQKKKKTPSKEILKHAENEAEKKIEDFFSGKKFFGKLQWYLWQPTKKQK